MLVDGTELHSSPQEAAKRPFWSGRKEKDPFGVQEAGSSSTAGDDERGGLESQEAQETRREPVWAYAFRIIRDHELMNGDSFLSFAQRLGDSRLISLCMQRSPNSIVEKARHVHEADARLRRSE